MVFLFVRERKWLFLYVWSYLLFDVVLCLPSGEEFWLFMALQDAMWNPGGSALYTPILSNIERGKGTTFAGSVGVPGADHTLHIV